MHLGNGGIMVRLLVAAGISMIALLFLQEPPRITSTIIPIGKAPVNHVTIPQDGKLLLGVAEGMGILWDLEQSRNLGPLDQHPGTGTETLSSDGKIKIALTRDTNRGKPG